MPPASIAYNDVSTVLWEERELLDGLAFTLEMQRLVLLPGHDRWVARVCREVELSLDRLRPAQLARTVHVRHLADQLGFDDSPSLRVIAEVAEEPWNDIFSSHRRAFLELSGEIHRLAEQNREWLAKSQASSVAASTRLFAGSSGDTDRESRPVQRLPGEDG